MKVGELIAKLSRIDPTLPVIMEQNDEPMGDYEVLDVDVWDASPSDTWHSSAGGSWNYPEVWNTYDGNLTKVVRLGSEPPWQPTIDADVEQKAIDA